MRKVKIDFKKEDRHVVPVLDNYLSMTLDETEQSMVVGDANVYQQSGRLLTAVRFNDHRETPDDPEPDDHGQGKDDNMSTRPTKARRAGGALVTIELTRPLLLVRMAESTQFVKFDMRRAPRFRDPENPDKRGDWRRIGPPPQIADLLLSKGTWHHFPVLDGTVEAPTLRDDGSILQTEGYDAASKLIFDAGGTHFPHIKDDPTPSEVAAGLTLLKDAIGTFPFAPIAGEQWGGASASRSVALSAILTGVVRRTLRTAPAHAIEAPTPGTGKTKLAEVVAVIATGHAPTAISYGKTQEEFEKRIFSVLLTGDGVVLIDNIEADAVSSDEFCTILTSERIKNRVLGVSKMAEVRTNVLFLLNGNNVVFEGDIVDRVVVAGLDARLEDPKTRKFDRDPVVYARDRRTELVGAALTILRAHAVAGYPGAQGLVPSRFPDWDRMVRGALVWMGEPDPQATRERLAVVDPVRDTHLALLKALENAVGLEVRFKAQDLIDRAAAYSEGDAGKFRWPPFTLDPLEEAEALDEAIGNALAAMGGNSRAITAQRVGHYLGKYEGRIFGGLVIRAQADAKRGGVYWVSKA